VRGRDGRSATTRFSPEGELSNRPTVTVVVPFAGSDAQLRELRATLGRLRMRSGDELIVSDNRRDPVRTPAYARNRGAQDAHGEWLVFIDSDTVPDAGLLDAYFDPSPRAETAVLAGGIEDFALRSTAVARINVARARMSHRATLERDGTPYAQTANCAIRRAAFEAVGAFDAGARAAEDADLGFRLRHAGWMLEERPGAGVRHRSRETLGAWLAQMVRHGSGAAWLERRWPGELPAAPVSALIRRIGRDLADAGSYLARGQPAGAADPLLDLLGAMAFELGRLVPNTPARRLSG
jgi:Glycosyltransferase like family 2